MLILPNFGTLSDEQLAHVRRFVDGGGSVIATSESTLYDVDGEARSDFALADLFGVHRQSGSHGAEDTISGNLETHARHTYLRLAPELRAGVYGPKDATAPAPAGARHPILKGLEAADTIPFGGYLPVVSVDADVEVLATFIPDFPIYPPETSWMREPKTDLPAITVKQAPSGGKLVWFVADLDRCFARDESFEHALLFANAIRWALGTSSKVTLSGTHGVITADLYEQPGKQILHLNNRLQLSRVPGRQYDLVPIGPVEVRLLVGAAAPSSVKLRVDGKSVPATKQGNELVFVVDQILDHEVVVIETN